MPNVAIAKSFSHGGVKSMKVEPRAITGVARAVKNAPISSATDSTTAAAATPASAARAVGRQPLAACACRAFRAGFLC